MDQLSADQQESLRKSSSERLRLMAARLSEGDDEAIAAMDRPALLQTVARGLATKKGDEEGATSETVPQKSEQLRELELQLELKRMEIDMENRRLEMENKRLNTDREMKKMEIDKELELKRMELKLE